MSNITIVICTMNTSQTIRQVLESVKDYKVIIIDASNELERITLEDIVSEYDNVKMYRQKSKGLGAARNEGLKKVRTKYVMMLGSDNMFPKKRNVTKVEIDKTGQRNIKNMDTIEACIDHMGSYNWIGIAFLTLCYNNKKYFDRCVDLRWQYRFYEGEREVIGTPYIYETKILKQYMYDDKMDYADDADLGARLKADGHKQGYSPYYVYDVTPNTFKEVKHRFIKYGESDSNYYKKYSKGWSFWRKVKSLSHPARCEYIPCLWYIPFYIMIVSLRYWGWIRK